MIRYKLASLTPSDILRRALATEGWWKLAREIKSQQGLAPPDEPTLASAVQALSHKLAADRANLRTIHEGIAALKRFREET